MTGSRRKPWLAGLLSLFVPGLGHIYNGQARKGVLLYCLYGIVALASVVILLELSLAPLNVVLPLGVLLAGYLYILLDAVKMARSKRDTFQPIVGIRDTADHAIDYAACLDAGIQISF